MKKTKLNFRCPLCGGPFFNVSWDHTKKVCRLVCPASLENGGNRTSCDIFCYFSCAKRDITISYRDILRMTNHPKALDWRKGCSEYVKIYREIFNRCFSLLFPNKAFRFE